MSDLVADVRGVGPPVVLLHGQPGSRHDWHLVADRLAEEFLVIVPDRPGYGDTGGRARGFRGNAGALASLLDRLDVPRATIVGHSWAGGVALALAESAAPRLTGLVLVSSVAPDEPLGRLDRLLAVPSIGVSLTLFGSLLATGAVALPPIRQRLLRDQEDKVASGLALDLLVASLRHDHIRQSFLTEQQCLVTELPSLAGVLPSISVPTRVLVGSHDRTVPPASGRRLARAIPGAALVELAGAGHLLAYERPAAVAAAIRAVAAPPPGRDND
ncbi:MAG TPA: alpha/beta hydrolase [Acidimicrobiales bacterium]|nr:alpha/beta hydrolase [Acidimicrobiales bacterium]